MNLAFSSSELRTLCETQASAEDQYGLEVAAALRARLADIRDAANVLELLAGQPREIADGNRRCYEIALPDGLYLVICANHDPPPLQEGTGTTDWSRVTRVKISRIERREVSHG